MRTFLSFLFTCLSLSALAQGYNIQFSSNAPYGKAYLAYYMGRNLSVQDSAEVAKTGKVQFKGKALLPPGIYTIVYANKSFSSDFLIGKNQSISIKADTANPANTNITGDADNEIFMAYQNVMAVKGKQLMRAKLSYEEATTAADSALHEATYDKLNDEMNAYRYNIINTQPQSMMAALLLAMKGPPMPEKIPVTLQDSLDNFQFYKQHYWDGFDFSDDRLVRTPFFLPRLEGYYRNVLQQSEADTIIKDIDYKLVLARSSPQMYQFLLNWFTDEYINPKYMGQDAVFVHLYEKYHSKGLTYWLNEKQLKTITDRAYMQMSNLIGRPAENILLTTADDKPMSLYDVQSAYTLLVFWDPTCGHCKETIPRIDSFYNASWKQKGVKIVGVLTEKKLPEWKDFLTQHKLGEWVNLYQNETQMLEEKQSVKPGYRQNFDVVVTPTILLLDDKKRIIAKKLSIDQLHEFLMVKTSGTKP